jgi:hypothetical protein
VLINPRLRTNDPTVAAYLLHRWQLMKVTDEDKLNVTERKIYSSHLPSR